VGVGGGVFGGLRRGGKWLWGLWLGADLAVSEWEVTEESGWGFGGRWIAVFNGSWRRVGV
jgi:hypothetical protein